MYVGKSDYIGSVEVLYKHHPVCLVARELLWLLEICQILMVGEKSDRVFGPLEVVPPVIESMDDSK